MQAVTRKKRITAVDLRARGPLVARAIALLLLIGGGVFVGVSYYKMRHNTPFRLRSEAPSLSKEITGIINGYERRITKNDRLYLWLRAARDVTYADGHHELEQINVQSFPATGDKPDQIVADRALYDQKTKLGETSAHLTFERDHVSGEATGALVDNEKKRLELKSAVVVTVAPEE